MKTFEESLTSIKRKGIQTKKWKKKDKKVERRNEPVYTFFEK